MWREASHEGLLRVTVWFRTCGVACSADACLGPASLARPRACGVSERPMAPAALGVCAIVAVALLLARLDRVVLRG